MPKTRVRDAVSSDFPTLLSIDKASFPPGIAYDSAELDYFMRRQGARTLVAELDSEIAGFILLEIVARRKCATLVTLDILDRFRRRGLATKLLAHSEEILRDQQIARYDLQVDVHNSRANAFYVKHGFHTVWTIPKYYANGNDAYFMSKLL